MHSNAHVTFHEINDTHWVLLHLLNIILHKHYRMPKRRCAFWKRLPLLIITGSHPHFWFIWDQVTDYSNCYNHHNYGQLNIHQTQQLSVYRMWPWVWCLSQTAPSIHPHFEPVHIFVYSRSCCRHTATSYTTSIKSACTGRAHTSVTYQTCHILYKMKQRCGEKIITLITFHQLHKVLRSREGTKNAEQTLKTILQSKWENT